MQTNFELSSWKFWHFNWSAIFLICRTFPGCLSFDAPQSQNLILQLAHLRADYTRLGSFSTRVSDFAGQATISGYSVPVSWSSRYLFQKTLLSLTISSSSPYIIACTSLKTKIPFCGIVQSYMQVQLLTHSLITILIVTFMFHWISSLSHLFHDDRGLSDFFCTISSLFSIALTIKWAMHLSG